MEDINVMSIGGYCLSIWILGKNRIRGPIDNVVLLSAETIKLLIENKYYSYLKHHKPKKLPRKDLPNKKCFQYDNLVQIYHNNPYDEKFKPELKKRVNNLNDFYRKLVKKKNYYFILCIPHSWVNIYDGKLKNNELEKCINLFKNYKILDKIIFVGNRQSDKLNDIMYYNTYLNKNDLDYLKAKYSINYIELNDTIIEKDNAEELNKLHCQFQNKLNEFLNTRKEMI